MGPLSLRSIASCCLVLVLFSLALYNYYTMTLFFPNVGEERKSVDYRNAFSPIARLEEYCSASTPVAEDGRFERSKDWRLRYLAINIRHGDRSSIHNIPGALEQIKGEDYTYVEEEALSFRSALSSFMVSFKPSSPRRRRATEIPESEPLDHVLDASHVFHIKDLDLAPGQLTTRGFMQHIRLGRALRASYRDLMNSIKSPNQIYVRSTNYVRTIQSVTGMLTTLLPQLIVGSIAAEVGPAGSKVGRLV